MDVATAIIIFIVVAIICVVIRVLCIIACRSITSERPQRIERRVIRRIRIDPATSTATVVQDRQGNAFPVADETGRADNRYNDIFFIEPNSPEAARIRAQLEKDDKDLPSYEEVMRMTNLATPTAAPANNDNFVPAMPSALTMGASSSSVNTTDTTLSVPPYRPADPNVSSSSRPLTPPPYTPEPIGASVVLPITTPLHSQHQQTQNS